MIKRHILLTFFILLLFFAWGCSRLTTSVSNNSPSITSVAQPDTYIDDSDVVQFNVAATDADGDPLTYSWQASVGSFSSPNSTSTTWTAPDYNNIYGIVPVFVNVSDGKDTSSYSWTMHINYAAGVTPTSNNSNNQNSGNGTIYTQPVTIDPTITPAIPAGFYVNTQVSQLILTWNAVTTYVDGSLIGSNLAGYRIYRATTEEGPFNDNTPFYLLKEVSANITTYTQTAIGVLYYYKITAISNDGVESLQSGVVCSIDDVAPAVPAVTGVRAYNPVSNSLSVYWGQNGETDVAGYRVYRADGAANHDGVYKLVGETGESGYTDTSVPAIDNYWFRVSAYDYSGNESPMSHFIQVDNIVPAAVQGFTAVTVTSSITLFWRKNTEADLGGYRIYFLTSDFATWSSGIELAGESEINSTLSKYVVSGESGTTYYFYILAVDRYGNYSPQSNKISAVIP